MNLPKLIVTVALALVSTLRLDAQRWRENAAHVGNTTRVLLVGTRPDDEDNALITWLSRGRHIETAFVSLTRGEGGRNVAGAERDAPLAVVRTAELLAERAQDGAHQYFTRAFDVGNTTSDSLVARAWPRDSVLIDMVAVIRAFRPHVVIALSASDSDADAGRRYTARLLAAAFTIAADTTLMSSSTTARLPAWSVSRLFTRVDNAGATPARITSIDVGEFDRAEGRSYAEFGAEVRRLQRTQGVMPVPSLGATPRLLRLDSARVGGEGSLFGTMDTTFSRLRSAVPPEGIAAFDTLQRAITAVTARASSLAADSLAMQLADVVRAAIAVRVEMQCLDESGVPTCAGTAGDLALSLQTIRERSTDALLDAAGIVIDGNAERELVAAGDSVRVALTVYNGGGLQLALRRLAVVSPGHIAIVLRDTTVRVDAGVSARFDAQVRLLSPSRHWWQINGLVQGTLLQTVIPNARSSVAAEQIIGEDRLPGVSIQATLLVAGVEVPVIVSPVVTRNATASRGDARHPVIGVPETSLLFERGGEYMRAGTSVDRLFRVYVSNARSSADTVAVALQVPLGLRADSAAKTVPLPPFSARNVFFRLQGALPAGTHAITASARSVAAAPVNAPPARVFTLGVVINEYPHIPSQHFVRTAKDRLESVDLKLPPNFRVAYIRGSEDLRPAFQQLRLNVLSLDLALVPVADLTGVTALIVGAGALRNESALLAVPPLRAYLERGGVVLVLPGGRELARSQLFPHPVDMNEANARGEARGAELHLADPASPLFSRPNVITEAELETWSGDRNCSLTGALYSSYAVPLVVSDAARQHVEPSVLVARVGKGTIVVTSLCLAQQIEGAHPGAAKLLINMLSLNGAVRPR